MKHPIRPCLRVGARSTLLCMGLLAVLANPAMLHAAANDKPEFEIGTDFDKELSTAGSVMLNGMRLILFGAFIWTLVRFLKDKKLLDLVYVAGSIVGFAFSKRIVTSLLKWGGNAT